MLRTPSSSVAPPNRGQRVSSARSSVRPRVRRTSREAGSFPHALLQRVEPPCDVARGGRGHDVRRERTRLTEPLLGAGHEGDSAGDRLSRDVVRGLSALQVPRQRRERAGQEVCGSSGREVGAFRHGGPRGRGRTAGGWTPHPVVRISPSGWAAGRGRQGVDVPQDRRADFRLPGPLTGAGVRRVGAAAFAQAVRKERLEEPPMLGTRHDLVEEHLGLARGLARATPPRHTDRGPGADRLPGPGQGRRPVPATTAATTSAPTPPPPSPGDPPYFRDHGWAVRPPRRCRNCARGSCTRTRPA